MAELLPIVKKSSVSIGLCPLLQQDLVVSGMIDTGRE